MTATYILKMLVCSLTFAGYYYFLLKNKGFHQFNRFFLAVSCVASILLPLMYHPIDLGLFPVEESVIKPAPIANEAAPEWNWQISLYMAGAVMATLAVIRSLSKIIQMSTTYRSTSFKQVRIFLTNEPATPFTFFSNIYWNNKIRFCSPRGKQVLQHEMAHAQQGHSFDNLLMEIITIIFWFNPIFHWMKWELKTVHEFLADKHALRSGDPHQYAELLIRSHATSLPLTNHFFHHNLKRRIAMIIKPSTSGNSWSRLMLVPLLLVLSFTVTKESPSGRSSLLANNNARLAAYADTTPEVIRQQEAARQKALEKQIRELEVELEALRIEKANKNVSQNRNRQPDLSDNLDRERASHERERALIDRNRQNLNQQLQMGREQEARAHHLRALEDEANQLAIAQQQIQNEINREKLRQHGRGQIDDQPHRRVIEQQQRLDEIRQYELERAAQRNRNHDERQRELQLHHDMQIQRRAEQERNQQQERQLDLQRELQLIQEERSKQINPQNRRAQEVEQERAEKENTRQRKVRRRQQ